MVIINKLSELLSQPQSKNLPADVKRILIKNELINYFLKFIYDHSSYRQLSFYGGTCARVVYGLNRMSEDIDLDNSEGIDLKPMAKDLTDYVKGYLQIAAGDVYTQAGEAGVARWVVRLPILKDLDLSPYAKEKLHLKIEVSSQKQTAKTELTPVLRGGQSMVIRHFDKPSLMAGKMIACLERIWVKGRDFYDLIWYMEQKVLPNEEKLKKDGQESYTLASAWKKLRESVAKLKKADLADDLRPLFTDQVFVEAWLDNFHEWFKRYNQN